MCCELCPTDKVRACKWNMKNIGNKEGGGLATVSAFQMNRTLTNGHGWETVAKCFDQKWLNGFISFKRSSVIENVVIGYRIIKTRSRLRCTFMQNWDSGNDGLGVIVSNEDQIGKFARISVGNWRGESPRISRFCLAQVCDNEVSLTQLRNNWFFINGRITGFITSCSTLITTK